MYALSGRVFKSCGRKCRDEGKKESRQRRPTYKAQGAVSEANETLGKATRPRFDPEGVERYLVRTL
jgi:hypothetical protein